MQYLLRRIASCILPCIFCWYFLLLDGTSEKVKSIDDENDDAELVTNFGCVEIAEPDNEIEDCSDSVPDFEVVNESDAITPPTLFALA